MLFQSLSSFKDLSRFDQAVLLMASQVQQQEITRRSSEFFVSRDLDHSGYLNETELEGAASSSF